MFVCFGARSPAHLFCVGCRLISRRDPPPEAGVGTATSSAARLASNPAYRRKACNVPSVFIRYRNFGDVRRMGCVSQSAKEEANACTESGVYAAAGLGRSPHARLTIPHTATLAVIHRADASSFTRRAGPRAQILAVTPADTASLPAPGSGRRRRSSHTRVSPCSGVRPGRCWPAAQNPNATTPKKT